MSERTPQLCIHTQSSAGLVCSNVKCVSVGVFARSATSVDRVSVDLSVWQAP